LKQGPAVGVAVVDHAGNPKSTWHNLKPIAMLNPCMVAPAAVKLQKGKPLELRYTVVIHDGPTPVELLSRLAKP